ncbi:hypothetical protein B0T14DRAFT_526476 [Immersiella caudata]|uniref:Heterokaryon incompatibility domain-containing protein n=1 Tax=Immersiella caudata TaxID=314043 RepID=A0AA40BTZ2_9PEZI|nr:hypothetical protein B0T14DRAFT_526476 [Immersiella caudata]
MSENLRHAVMSHADPVAPSLKRKRRTSFGQPVVTFYVANELRQTPQSSFLSYVWTTGLDSDCLACAQPFHPNGAAPIRTIGLEREATLPPSLIDITQQPISPWNLRIFNRHFSCIKAKRISYVPISHAWHESVAAAQDGRTESTDVSRLVFQTPVRTLLALVSKYPDAEIWHDYLSVPQWRTEVQGRLLLAIPEIYNYATTTLIHLDDVQGAHLSNHSKNSNYEKFIVDFSAVIRSRWFDRMWVALEYIQSNDIIILTKDYTISEANARDLCHRLDTAHSKWVKQRSNSDVTQDIWKQGTTLKRMNSWIDMEGWKNEHEMHKTLGWAIGILGHRQCRQSRDYLLALGKMVDFQPEQDPLVLVENRFQYFFSLATHALRRGDYTPLLFISPPGEQTDERAPWLRGYSTVSWKLWDLGRCHRKATHEQILRDGKVQPQLETVGIVEWFEHYDFEGAAESVIDYLASRILRAQGRDPKALCRAIDRIFPQDGRKGVNMEWRDPVSDDGTDSAQSYDLPKLQGYLEEYGELLDAQGGQEVAARRLGTARKMYTALKLGRRGKYAKETRLEMAAGEAGWFLREYGTAMEGISQISCKICGQRSVFRLNVWEEPTPNVAQVYRIPGLLYDDSVPEGVGILVEGKRIVGKMMYGTPACKCRRLEMVGLGPVKL